MYKILFTATLATISLISSASLYAHNEAPRVVSTDEKQKVAEQQQEKESWDSFMQAIDKQDAKKENANKTTQDDKHSH